MRREVVSVASFAKLGRVRLHVMHLREVSPGLSPLPHSHKARLTEPAIICTRAEIKPGRQTPSNTCGVSRGCGRPKP